MNNEFKKIESSDYTRYVLENAGSGGTSSGSIASMDTPLGKDQIVLQSRMGQPTAPKPRNFVAKNAKTGGAGAHKDKKKAEKQGDVKHKNKDMDMAEGKDDKIAQLKKDHDTAVHWSKNETSPQKREAARQKAEKIKRHLDTQYKQGVAEGFPKDPNAPKLVRDRKTGKQYDPNKEFEKKMNSPEVMAQMKRMAQKEGVEDRTSYQVAKILSDRGIKYDPAQENELINAIGMVLVKELNMTPKEARYLISYDEDFVADTMGELRSMEQSVSEVDVYMESLAESLQQVLSEKAVSKKQQKFMGMVHAAQKGEKPASKEVAKVAKGMGKKDAKDFASTKHKGLPEKKPKK